MAQVHQSQVVEGADNSCQNTDAVGDKTEESSEANLKDAAHNSILTEQDQSNKDTFQVPHMNREQDTECHHSNDIPHEVNGENDTTSNNISCHSEETEPKIVDYSETGNIDVMADMNIRDLSNDFGNTFMLDEEIELEQKMLKKTELSSTGRYFIVLGSD